MRSRKFLIYSNHCRKRTAHIWSQGKNVYLQRLLCVTDWACRRQHHFPVIPPYQTQQFLSPFIATEEQVLEVMTGVDTSKACGYDGVNNRIIKMCSDGFHVYFTRFINMSFSLSHFHCEWKLANVILIFKLITVNSKWTAVLFLYWQVFLKSVKRLFSFTCRIFWWRLVFFINCSLVSGLAIQQSTSWFSLYTKSL